jgi:hypothetical protein
MSKLRLLLLFLPFFGLSLNVQAGPQTGIVTPANSIIGGYASDQIGVAINGRVVELPNGNIVISSANWNGGRGAVTCLTPAQVKAGNIVISEANSLVGSNPGDNVGFSLTVLANGSYVVGSPNWHNGSIESAGAATWVSSTCIPANESSPGAVVSTNNSLVGTHTWDVVGDKVNALTNGHYVVSSWAWDNGNVVDVGAVTWGNGITGMVGVVSSSNSLIGSNANDWVSRGGITTLSNGNYVVNTFYWDNPETGADQAGAVTWRDGSKSTSGVVSASNSIIGTSTFDRIGVNDVRALPNGNYVVSSTIWDNPATGKVDVGAVTWGDGTTGLPVGAVSSSNSLVGASSGDAVGTNLTVLTNGHYVVRAPLWDNPAMGKVDVGAVTWANAATGLPVGEVSSSNSLVGSSDQDTIGSSSLRTLNNGHYVVYSNSWDNGPIADAGAVTWVNGTTSTTGTVSAANSLIGSTTGDQIGSGSFVQNSSSYLVNSPNWDHGSAANAGAVTWCNASTGCSGAVSTTNSLVGTTSGDQVGSGAAVLENSHYVVRSPNWDNGPIVDVGAVTWVNGTAGTIGAVNTGNSLIGSSVNDKVGSAGIIGLSSGSYVVLSPLWDGTNAADVGAATLRDGSMSTYGVVDASNSIVGSTASDRVGSGGVSLNNGNYVVTSSNWDNGSVIDAGAVTWCHGSTGCLGTVNAGNSLVGTTAGDLVGSMDQYNTSVNTLNNGNYVVRSPKWDHGIATDVGAVTWGNGTVGTVGPVGNNNSLTGSTANDLVGNYYLTQLANGDYLVVARYWDHGGTVDVGAITYSQGAQDAGVIVTETGGTEVTESGTGDSYSIVLNSKPSANVTITLALSSNEISASPTTLTFTSANWNSPQTVTVNANGDKIAEDIETATITHTVSSVDGYYHLLTVPSLTVTILPDDDTAGVDVSKTSMSVMEGGAADAYAVLLNSKPLDNVTVALSASTEFSTSAASLVFTPDNWQSPQTVIVTAVDDTDFEGTEVVTLHHTATSGDPKYHNFVAQNLSVTIVDNDTASVELLQNGEFETTDATKPSLPAQWSGKQLSKDKLKCNTADKTFAYEGNCAFLFKGAEGENASLQQKPVFEGQVFEGDTLSLSLYIRTKLASAGKVASVKVTYIDPTTGGDGKDKLEIKLNAATTNGEYQQYLDTLTLADEVMSIKVMLRNKNTSGKILIDNISLLVSAGDTVRLTSVSQQPDEQTSETGNDVDTVISLPSK